MKAAILAGVFVFVLLFVATTFPASPQAYAEAKALGFSDAQIEQGLQYAFGRRLLFWLSTALQLIALTIVVFGGWGVRLRDFCMRCSGGRWLPAVFLVGLICFAALELIDFPVALARHEYSRYWDMTEQPLVEWSIDYAKGLLIGLVAGGLVYVGFYLLVRWLPRWWWLPASIGALLYAVTFALLLPVVVAPLFNTFTPLSKTAHARLEKSIRTLARRADVPVQEVYVVDASRQSKHTNAYFTGFGATQQIVLYDTLLQEHPDGEVESVLAHEIGHWKHNHIVKGIILGGVAATLGLFLLSRLLLAAVGRRPFLLTSPFDPAGWPLILLVVNLVFWAVMPLNNAVSRHFEREADWTALELAGNPRDFIAAEMRLARVNRSNVAPTPFNVWLFSTHPPVSERIRMAEKWKKP